MLEIPLSLTTTKNKYRWLWCLGVFIVFSYNTLEAQKTDTYIAQNDTAFIEGDRVATPHAIKKHSPHKASMYSAILPGLGQAYNKKYWKIPIIYAGIGGLAYAIHFNTKFYNDYKAAYRDFVIRDPNNKSYLQFIPPGISEEEVYNQREQWFRDALKSKKQYYRRYRDLSYIGMITLYALQIVDASVDAHFYNFDISDDLSMVVQPSMMPPAPGEFAGMGLQLKFKF